VVREREREGRESRRGGLWGKREKEEMEEEK
jgi:hypothetical protein